MYFILDMNTFISDYKDVPLYVKIVFNAHKTTSYRSLPPNFNFLLIS